jgi:hypothetical protein
MMKYFRAALLALSIAPAVLGEECKSEKQETKLQFFGSELIQNDLHKPDGAMVYANVGIFENDQIDLEITAMDELNPDWPYSEIEKSWVKRNKPVPNNNGLYGSFGQINLQTIKGHPTSGQGNFKFCLKSNTTGELITLPSFSFSIYDLDKRGNGRVNEERLIVDMNKRGYKSFSVYPNMEASEAAISCEDPSESFPCATSRTVFRSTRPGVGRDNPSNPDKMTQKQLRRSVSLSFEDTSCFELTYDHFCPYDQDDYTGSVTNGCKVYGGGNFLFAGYSETISKNSECIALPTTTDSPTAAPTEGVDRSPKVDEGCPEDIKLVKTFGETSMDLSGAVQIVEQNKETVTVKLTNTWTDSSSDINQISTQYYETDLVRHCHNNSTVRGGETYNEITIQCAASAPFAMLKVCVSDDEAVMPGDNAAIPRCCQKETSDPTVCYELKINCETQCVQADERVRALRGTAK